MLYSRRHEGGFFAHGLVLAHRGDLNLVVALGHLGVAPALKSTGDNGVVATDNRVLNVSVVRAGVLTDVSIDNVHSRVAVSAPDVGSDVVGVSLGVSLRADEPVLGKRVLLGAFRNRRDNDVVLVGKVHQDMALVADHVVSVAATDVVVDLRLPKAPVEDLVHLLGEGMGHSLVASTSVREGLGDTVDIDVCVSGPLILGLLGEVKDSLSS